MEEVRLGTLTNRKIGYGIVQPGASVPHGIPVIKVNNIISGLRNVRDLDTTSIGNDKKYSRTKLKGGELIVSVVGTIGRTAIVPMNFAGCNLVRATALIDIPDVQMSKWVKYYIDSPKGQNYIRENLNTTVQPTLNVKSLVEMPIPVYSSQYMQKAIEILGNIDDKIEVNRRINDNFYFAFFEVMLIWALTTLRNDNLEKQAQKIFDSMFPSITSGEDEIGSIITPKRGKGLLSKDAVDGDVPVIAGGLESATFHNEANTKAPIVTISASGANAGFVNLWQIPVWSSDSSFIDSTMTEDVYFWYVMLKKRQKEIFDAQTGSAQPHIYPKHIAEMPLGKFEQTDVEKFTEIVTPMFEIRGRNLKESERLASIRDTLLPKLMSGELKLENVNV